MNPYVIHEMATLHAADLRREAEAHRLASAAAGPRLGDRVAAVVQALAARVYRPRAGRPAIVCCPA